MANAAITVDLNARIAQFETELKRAGASLDGFASKGNSALAGLKSFGAGLAGALSVGAITAFAKSGIDAADALNDMSQRLGVSVKDLASFKLAAEQSGTSLDGVGDGIARLSRSIGDAEGGNKKLAAALSELGVTARDPKEAFFQLADAVQRIDDPAKRATLLNQVLGKSYQELVPLLAQGGDELRKSAAASETFAEAMARLAPDADKFNDNLAELKINAAGFSSTILADLVPALNEMAERFGNLAIASKAGGFANIFGLSGNLPHDLPKINSEIKDLEATIARLRKNSGGLDSSIAPLSDQLADLRRIQQALKDESMRGALELAAQQYKKTPATGGGIDLSAATKKTGKPLDKNDLYSDEMARNAKLVADETERIAGDFAFMRDVDLAQSNPIAEMAQEWADAGAALHDSLKTPLESLEERLAYIDELMRRNVISVEDYGRAYADAFDEGNAKAEKTKSLAEEIGLSFTSEFEEAIVSGEKFGDVLDSLGKDWLKFLARKMVTEPLMNSISGSFGAGGGGQNLLGNLFGFASGGSFTVGGGGGTDSQLVAFRATPGEMVDVRTPGQARGSGVSVQINNYSGQPASSRESVDSRGNRRIEVTIGEAVAGEMRRAGSAAHSAVRGTFGASPALVGR